jgi:iron complex outermembrane receptor protein
MKKGFVNSLLLTASVLGASAAIPAYAQDSNGSEAIVVTARRVEERLQDVPISITVFNQQQLANRNVVNAQDLATYTPSLSANTNFGTENSSFAIRGFVQEIGTAPSVGVYFGDVVAPRGASNGIPTGDGAGPGSFFDLQNVQVLKGPQGTLFGRNTTGGAVLLVPQKPTGRLEGYVEGSIGNYDMRRIQAVVNVPVGDSFRMRLGIDRQTRDGYLHNTSGIGPSDFGDVDYTAIRFSAVADLAPNLENYTIISYSNSHTNGTPQKVVAALNTGLGKFATQQLTPGNPLYQGSGFYDFGQNMADPYSKLEQWQVINTTTWKKSDALTIKNIASYAQLKDDLNEDLFGTNWSISLGPIGTYPFGFTISHPIPGEHTANQSTFTEELQFQGNAMDNRLTWQAGAYFESSRPLGETGSQSSFLSSCTNVDTLQCTDPLGFGAFLAGGRTTPVHVGVVNYTAGRTTYRDIGLYAQGTYAFTDQLKLTGGFRYTWDREVNDSTRKGYILAYPPTFGLFPTSAALPMNPVCTDAADIPNGCQSHTVQSSQAPTWLIDLEYTPIQDVMLYAKYARGYRAGTIAPNVGGIFRIVQPEKVNTYELGLKSSFHGAVRGTFNVTGFYNDFSNQQIQLGFNAKPGAPVSSTASPVNAGKSELYGVEVNASLTPFHGFVLDGGYTWLKTRIKEVPDFSTFNDPNFTLNPAFRVGDPLVRSPENKFTINATYTLPVDEKVGTLSFGVTYTHSDSSLANYADRTVADPAIQALGILPATDLVNLNFSWNSIAGKPVDLSLFATNVTQEKYYTFVPGIAPGTQFETAQLGTPRMYGARLRYRFGAAR